MILLLLKYNDSEPGVRRLPLDRQTLTETKLNQFKIEKYAIRALCKYFVHILETVSFVGIYVL